MKALKATLTTTIALLASSTLSPMAVAQDSGFTGHVIVGGGMKPEYEGSEDIEATPYAAAKISYNQYYLESFGTDFHLNLSPYTQVEFGPVLGYGGGRDDDIENEAVAKFREIDDTFEAGAFIKIPVRRIFSANDELSFQIQYSTDTEDSYDGYRVSFGSNYKYLLSRRLRLSTSIKANFASKEYNQTYFGVDANNSIRSGLPEYKPGGGIYNVSLGMGLMYVLDSRWSVIGLINYKQIVGDAADSPIIDLEGSSDQVSAGVGIGYRF